jgi:hypothetical protein
MDTGKLHACVTILTAGHCPRCPLCGKQVSAFAVSTEDWPGEPASPFWGSGWSFAHNPWGAWCHIIVDGTDKLVYLTKQVYNNASELNLKTPVEEK